MKPSNKPIIRHWFKHHQRNGIYHYFEIVGGPGKTKDGYETIVNFLNPVPRIDVKHNFVSDPSALTGTWCRFEVAEPISKDEFERAYQKALTKMSGSSS